MHPYGAADTATRTRIGDSSPRAVRERKRTAALPAASRERCSCCFVLSRSTKSTDKPTNDMQLQVKLQSQFVRDTYRVIIKRCFIRKKLKKFSLNFDIFSNVHNCQVFTKETYFVSYFINNRFSDAFYLSRGKSITSDSGAVFFFIKYKMQQEQLLFLPS